jgi:hypothetical protein
VFTNCHPTQLCHRGESEFTQSQVAAQQKTLWDFTYTQTEEPYSTNPVLPANIDTIHYRIDYIYYSMFALYYYTNHNHLCCTGRKKTNLKLLSEFIMFESPAHPIYDRLA